ncbi:uncharacterized protein UV8b_04900 [Ustilaginoidea virens]|uniref:Uncharacterized protein n=1 Tax=Ustilaginoidea virens TaxID=1159556 RepID=A0A8E5HS65_USTVR|nr:uncharacterized protein UV8b_04900 [Ustilaginoidea virens]QUC20659.1 hypothetical protein UV8b_04900 [Ustilaginoidea virens]
MLDAVLKGPRSRVMPDDEMSRNVEHGKRNGMVTHLHLFSVPRRINSQYSLRTSATSIWILNMIQTVVAMLNVRHCDSRHTKLLYTAPGL